MTIEVVSLFAILFALLAGGLWIGLTLALTATLLLATFRSIPLDKLLPQYAWNILTSSMVKFAFASFTRGQLSTSSDTPLWFPQAVVTFGMLLLTLQFLARAIQAALGLPLEDHRMKASPVE